jgi:hypothetical protein
MSVTLGLGIDTGLTRSFLATPEGYGMRLGSYCLCARLLKSTLRLRHARSVSLECIHIFLWVAKDLCWMLDIFEMAVVFGSLALAWWYVPV